MEDAAIVLVPVIGDVLNILAAAPGCRLARMSGSGATCFALFANRRAAMKARRTIVQAHPDWWMKAAVLN
jgi:4-diphosphocytidyl-2-C-methyl-D-erythritol kinase